MTLDDHADGGVPVLWRELWAQTADAVGDRARARWLCEVASASIDGNEFQGRLDEPATVRMVVHLDAMVARYRTGEVTPHSDPIELFVGSARALHPSRN